MSLAKEADFLGQSSSHFGMPELNSSTTIEPGTSNTGRTWLKNDATTTSSIAPDRRIVGCARRAKSSGGIATLLACERSGDVKTQPVYACVDDLIKASPP
jgi:hypothetical protein